ncbi:hypothetical protein ACH5RR_023399 [Cinchona calisaya]|uniref:RNase H type-1 domain-containing protein n=1 Tax=Cinchona calisaya TaxID=153742 RepID=A0ABD2ZEG7_9GENT
MIYGGIKFTSAQIIHAVLTELKSIFLAFLFIAKDIRDQQMAGADCIAPNIHFRPIKVLSLAWNPSPQGWCKLNSDGAVKVNGCSLGGGIIRDQNGNLMAAFLAC